MQILQYPLPLIYGPRWSIIFHLISYGVPWSSRCHMWWVRDMTNYLSGTLKDDWLVVAEAMFENCTSWSNIFTNLVYGYIFTPGISLIGSGSSDVVGNIIADAVNMAQWSGGVIPVIITTGHIVGDIAAVVDAGVADDNIWCGTGHPISVHDNFLITICGGGGTRNAGYLLCVTGPGLIKRFFLNVSTSSTTCRKIGSPCLLVRLFQVYKGCFIPCFRRDNVSSLLFL